PTGRTAKMTSLRKTGEEIMRLLHRADSIKISTAAIMAIVLGSCQESPRVLPPLDQPSQLQAAEPRVSGAVQGVRERLQSFESRGSTAVQPAAGAESTSSSTQSGDVTLNFVDTDIREIVRAVLGTTLKLNYTIDPSVQGAATLVIERPLARSQLLPALETVLNQNGATMTQRDGIYRILPVAAAASVAPMTKGDAFGFGTEVVQLRYVSAKDLAKMLEPYVADGGKIAVGSGRNALAVSGDPQVRQLLTSMIRAFDIDVLAGQSYALFPAGDGNAAKLAGELEKVFRSEGEGPLADVVRVVPMQRVNAVLVVSAQPRYIEEARRFLGLERRAQDATARSWHVYYVQNGQSADLENLLQRAFTPGRATSPGGQA